MNLTFNPTLAQTLIMTGCMLAVAHVDGVQAAESSLIESFYASGWDSTLPQFKDLSDFHKQAPGLLPAYAEHADFPESLVWMCLATGYADGTLSASELELVQSFSKSLGMTESTFNGVLQEVRDSLMGAFSHLPDAGSVAALAKEL